MEYFNREESEKRRKNLVEECEKNPYITLQVLSNNYNISREGARKLLKKSGLVCSNRFGNLKSEPRNVWGKQNVQK